MSESESAGALGTLFFYVLFVHPVCAWILAPKRFRKDRAIVYAILFLATIAFGKMVSLSPCSATWLLPMQGRKQGGRTPTLLCC